MGLTARIPNLTPHSKKKERKKNYSEELWGRAWVSPVACLAMPTAAPTNSLCDASSCPSSLGEVGNVSMLQTCPEHVVTWLTGHLILADG